MYFSLYILQQLQKRSTHEHIYIHSYYLPKQLLLFAEFGEERVNSIKKMVIICWFIYFLSRNITTPQVIQILNELSQELMTSCGTMTPEFFKIKNKLSTLASLVFRYLFAFVVAKRLLGQSRNDRLSGDRKAASSLWRSRQRQGAAFHRLPGPVLFNQDC